ncbi:GvpL/GvpF family gas vesicle protein [Actinocatenispora sera]|uniref:GvpL/GvpF family gas vesicle protein n=1 Tax=Actinocatenispora sera TaxID=390989 RepID=UPI0033C64E2E
MRQVDGDDVAELVRSARAEARALVHAELVEQFASIYRAAARDAIGSAVPGEDGPGTARREESGAARREVPATVVRDAPGAARRDEETGDGWYVYALARAEAVDGLTGRTGIDGVETTVVEAAGVAAMSAVLPIAPFRAAEREPDLAEDGWLAHALRAHDRVVAEAFDAVPLLPLRFGTLYPDRDAVVSMLRTGADELRAELDRLAGSAEWSVKAFSEAPAEPVEQPSPDPVPSDGTGWMTHQLRTATARQHRQRQRTAAAAAIGDRLAGYARETWQRRGADNDPTRPVLDTVYLVDDDARVDFLGELEELRRRELRLTVSGPNPAYHFVRLGADDG